MRALARTFGALSGLFALGSQALAQPVDSGPFNWQVNLQEAASEVAQYVDWFAWYTLAIMLAVCVFVFGLMAWCAVRFNAKRNPEPARFAHNTTVEVLWTVLPVLILVLIAVPSFRLLYGQFDPSKIYSEYNPETDKFLTVKVTGHQWYWGYEYGIDDDSKSNGITDEISFQAFMIPDEDLPENGVRNLSVDNPVVVPVDTFVRVQVTSADVIHSFAMPPFGIKIDAVPGRLNETYFKANREGLFYGQCSELCGKDHAFMPIAMRVVSKDQFQQWASQAVDDIEGANQSLAQAIQQEKQNNDDKVALR
ncbi:cytochrome c oxidase subunit II [Afifella aestuarii]|uniref:cytochrome c oxidase subunit II n=1 Tax=Afifella aestuarii TaxID=1909496 RepID=UPI000FE3DC8B|nr:cytochrome c oxidase subunit II [Afifella aestuarii]